MSNNLAKERRWLIKDKYKGIQPKEDIIRQDLERFKLGEPLDYIIGWKPFLNIKIDLSSRPLIPRVETEYWVGEIISQSKNTTASRRDFKIMDMCAGSGCVGLAFLKSFNSANCTFVDIESKNIDQIRLNASINNISESAYKVILSDLWQDVPLGDKFDIILCNPPYIPKSRLLDKSVLDFEPSIALYSGDDGLDAIRRFICGLAEHLSLDGIAYMEFDLGQQDEIKKIASANNLKADIFKDQFNIARYCKITHL